MAITTPRSVSLWHLMQVTPMLVSEREAYATVPHAKLVNMEVHPSVTTHALTGKAFVEERVQTPSID